MSVSLTLKRARLPVLALATGVAVVLAGSSWADRGGSSARLDFATLDADGDGQITPSEMRAGARGRFATQDTDGDGFLTAEEAASAKAARFASRFERMLSRRDANGDGRLSLEELHPSDENEDRRARMFERLDTDRSGGISQEELAQMRDEMQGRKWGKKRHQAQGE